jgi:hypothetical protein
MRGGISALWAGHTAENGLNRHLPFGIRIRTLRPSLDRALRHRYLAETDDRKAELVKQKRAWISRNALEVTLLGVGSAFVTFAVLMASLVGMN